MADGEPTKYNNYTPVKGAVSSAGSHFGQSVQHDAPHHAEPALVEADNLDSGRWLTLVSPERRFHPFKSHAAGACSAPESSLLVEGDSDLTEEIPDLISDSSDDFSDSELPRPPPEPPPDRGGRRRWERRQSSGRLKRLHSFPTGFSQASVTPACPPLEQRKRLFSRYFSDVGGETI